MLRDALLSLGFIASSAFAAPSQSAVTGLHDAAVARGRYFGTATHSHWEDTAYVAQLDNNHDVGQLVDASFMKMDATQPRRGVFNFTRPDKVVSYAKSTGRTMRCHALLWHTATPAWVENGNFDNATLISIIQDHITEVVKHFKGECYAWDVVNEALYINGTWRETVFYNTIGPSYVPIAFAAAAAADPTAKLYINEFGIEFPGPKSEGTLQIAELVRAHGVRIDGVGLQGHYDQSGDLPEAHFELGSMPTYDEQVAALRMFADAGFEVAITEMDVSIKLPGDEAKYKAQAEVYANATAACLTVEKCVGVTIWDWTDRYTWVPNLFPDLGDALPWDVNLRKKPAYEAILKTWQAFGL